MKRVALLLLVCLACASSVEAQVRLRRRSPRAVAAGNPVVTITTPTSASTHSTSETTLTISGTAAPSSGRTISAVTWACPQCSPTSGTATLIGTDWSITGSVSSATVFQDSFNSATTSNLASHTPNVGTSWAEAVDTLGTLQVNVQGSSNYIQPSASSTNNRLIYLATPNPAISGTSYDVSWKVTLYGGANEAHGAIFGYTDTSNYCGVKTYVGTMNPDVVLFKRVAGVNTTLASANIGAATGSTVKVQVRGSSLTVLVNDVSVASATDSFCDDALGVGVGFGALNGTATDQVSVASRMDDFTVVDQGASSGVTFALGANAMTVTATDSAAATGNRLLTITRSGADTTAPVCVISSPTLNATYSAPTSSVVVEGTCTDNVETSTVSVGCPTCTVPDPVCVVSGSGTSRPFACPAITVATGNNTVTVTGTDAALNTGPDVLTVSYNPADATPPTIVITTNGGAGAGVSFTTTSSSQAINGTAADTGGSGLDRAVCTCATCTPSTVTAGGISSFWTTTFALANGANQFSCTAFDVAGNASTPDTITVTYNQTLTITTVTMPAGTTSTAYQGSGVTLVASGGTSPYTWSNNAAGTTLNDADAHCAGLSISAAGVVTGTPTTAGTCDWTAKVTDNVAATDTQALSIVVSAPGSGPHAYFDGLVSGGYFLTGYSMRPLAGHLTSTDPYYTNQLTVFRQGGVNATLATPDSHFITYCYTGTEPGCSAADTDTSKQDGAKVTLPSYLQSCASLTSCNTVNTGGVDASVTVIPLAGPTTTGPTIGSNSRAIKIDNEIMVASSVVGFDPANPTANRAFRTTAGVLEVRVVRGQFGTTAAAHLAGATVERSAFGIATGSQIRFNFPTTTSGNSYVITWDMYYTPSYLGIQGNSGSKVFQIGSTSAIDDRFLEAKTNYLGSYPGYPYSQFGPSTGPANCWVPGQTIWLFTTRVYNNQYAGAATWADSGGGRVGPGTTDDDPLLPVVGEYCARPGRWIRVWWRLTRASDTDYDAVEAWIADEATEPIKIYNGNLVSMTPSSTGVRSLEQFWWEFNDTYVPHAMGIVNPFRDKVTYLRNWAVLLNPPADLAAAGILVKPQ